MFKCIIIIYIHKLMMSQTGIPHNVINRKTTHTARECYINRN